MANATFNAGIDYFGLETATSNALKVTSSNENRSKQSTSGANTYGDAAKVDSWGETAAPSAEYQIIDTLTQAGLPDLGTVIAASDSHISIDYDGDGTAVAVPVVLGGFSISTQNGSAPTATASGQTVQSGATQLRAYELPAFSVSPRHRAQDFLGLCTIKIGTSAADDTEDYGLESVSAEFPIEFTLAQPKGELKNYDLHGGMATCSFTMNWYASTAPTVALSTVATTLGATMSEPVAKSDPEGGYTQYTWTVSFPMIGEEHSSS